MKTTSTSPTLEHTTKKENVIKSIVLDGTSALRIEVLTTFFDVLYQLNSQATRRIKVLSKVEVGSKTSNCTFPLTEVTPKMLSVYRSSEAAGFVLKVDGKFYYTKIPKNSNFSPFPFIGEHKCSTVGHECRRLSAKSDEQGGCAKVRDRYKCIENYPWITKGYETFNTFVESFVVIDCLHYENCHCTKSKK